MRGSPHHGLLHQCTHSVVCAHTCAGRLFCSCGCRYRRCHCVFRGQCCACSTAVLPAPSCTAGRSHVWQQSKGVFVFVCLCLCFCFCLCLCDCVYVCACACARARVCLCACAFVLLEQTQTNAPLNTPILLQAIYDMIRAYLDAGGERSAEVLWRYARACRDYSQEVADKQERKRLIFEVSGCFHLPAGAAPASTCCFGLFLVGVVAMLGCDTLSCSLPSCPSCCCCCCGFCCCCRDLKPPRKRWPWMTTRLAVTRHDPPPALSLLHRGPLPCIACIAGLFCFSS